MMTSAALLYSYHVHEKKRSKERFIATLYCMADTPIRELRVLLTPRQEATWPLVAVTRDIDCDAESVPWPEYTVSAVPRGWCGGAGIEGGSTSASTLTGGLDEYGKTPTASVFARMAPRV